MHLKKKVFSIVAIVIALTILSGIVYAIVEFASGKTMTATVRTLEESYETMGLIIKNEKVIDISGDEFIRYYFATGDKVYKNAKIVSLYGSEEDGNIISEIERIEKKIENLSDEYVNLTAKDTLKLENYISEDIENLGSANKKSDLTEAKKIKDRLTTLFNIKNQGESDVKATEKELLNEKTTLEARLSRSKRDITSPMSGIFSTSTDGFEEKISIESAKNLTVSGFDSLMDESVIKKSNTCKIVDNYSWQIALKVPSDYVVNKSAGQGVILVTDDKVEIEGKIEYISQAEDGYVILLVSSDKDFSGIGTERKMNVKIIFFKRIVRYVIFFTYRTHKANSSSG